MNNEAIKSKERYKNSGAPFPNAQFYGFKLIAALLRLKKRYPPLHIETVTPFDRALFNFLYLWLTGSLASCKSIEDIPDITIVSGSHPCQPNSLRSIRKSAPSWIEYAIAVPTKHGVNWQWQPIPNGLNHWFSDAITKTKQTEKCWILEKKEKEKFFSFINDKWRTPTALKGKYLTRKDALFNYFNKMAQCDPNLPTPAKAVLLGVNKLHHFSALNYQRRDSEQIRYDIFKAQTHYLDRLRQAITEPALISLFSAPKPITHTDSQIIHFSAKQQDYLCTPGRIPSLHYDVSTALRTYIQSPPIYLGSLRQVKVDSVRRFFHELHLQGQKLERSKHTQETLLELYNFRVFELALLFIVLTSTRPTHEITFLKEYCFDKQSVIVFDKGCYRSIWLCEYFRHALSRYEFLQQNLRRHSSTTFDTPLMWFLVDNHLTVKPLSAKSLRQFTAKWWAKANSGEIAVPYQLRHFFAQHALTSSSPTLTSQDIDRLMGHANWGEQLGSDMLFPVAQNKLTSFLNKIPEFLNLAKIEGAHHG
ncbi:site-specific integrase [Shewanella aestuarii]|uniref:Site-specific integrase n=1 Tax=Shewanella aestuarii TaxID=1028752 RepID=A0A6G9QKT3_9GAMM|nr:site-specific integrase [Shewanella aestuarii]QIR15082.1 site-specific integrase [Shewanella aestuarii]